MLTDWYVQYNTTTVNKKRSSNKEMITIKQSTACSGDAINATSDKSSKGGMPHTLPPNQPLLSFFLPARCFLPPIVLRSLILSACLRW